jgi:hypothetical protein
MWLVNDDGFFSTIQDREDAGWVYVRGRSETDMEAFVAVAGQAAGDGSWEGEVVHTPHRDYAFRVHTPREVWADYLAAKANDLGYGNFKNHCKDQWTAENRDSTAERLDLLLDAWMLFNHWPDNHL